MFSVWFPSKVLYYMSLVHTLIAIEFWETAIFLTISWLILIRYASRKNYKFVLQCRVIYLYINTVRAEAYSFLSDNMVCVGIKIPTTFEWYHNLCSMPIVLGLLWQPEISISSFLCTYVLNHAKTNPLLSNKMIIGEGSMLKALLMKHEESNKHPDPKPIYLFYACFLSCLPHN